jgi:phage terminase large subunit-like protein
VAGVDRAGHLWVLRDASGRMKPEAWARRAVELCREHRADRIVAEANQGGDMVAATIAAVDRAAPVRLVHATRGKAVRAEPVSALYEQGRAHHVAATPRAFETLEDQLCSWAPGDAKSPDRLDALVWAATDLVIASTAVGAMVPASSDTGRDASPWAR